MNYNITINIDYYKDAVSIECPQIQFLTNASLQSSTVGYVLTNPIKLITSEIKERLQAYKEGAGK